MNQREAKTFDLLLLDAERDLTNIEQGQFGLLVGALVGSSIGAGIVGLLLNVGKAFTALAIGAEATVTLISRLTDPTGVTDALGAVQFLREEIQAFLTNAAPDATISLWVASPMNQRAIPDNVVYASWGEPRGRRVRSHPVSDATAKGLRKSLGSLPGNARRR